MKYFIILLSAIATASALAVPEAQPESLDKRQKCYTAVLLAPILVPRTQSSAAEYEAELLSLWLAKAFGINVGSIHQSV
ncbi:hypothetical protein BM1_01857 [Bipolaris maydis]|nr:hypothetical protein BM1_01857 [Bipolaris maydis]